MVLGKCRNWGARVGQIRFSDDTANPTISIMLTGVDIESILEKAKSEDNHGNRRRKIWEILCEQFGIENTDELQLSHETLWRGTRRSFDVLFTNVRELPDVSLQNEGPKWKVIVDFPLDVEGHGPADDVAWLEKFASNVGGRQLTIAWLPSFLSLEVQRELGKLVLLDHCLKEERFNALAAHLSPMDRVSAKSLMENQRSQLRQKIVKCLEAAYGTDTPPPGALDTTHDLATHVFSLDDSFKPQSPVGANLRQQMEHLVGQALDHQYPGHPLFEAEVRPAMLKNKIYPEVQRALQSPDGRVLVDQGNRAVLKLVVNPLRIGEMAETHLVLGTWWKNHFERKQAAAGGTLTVEKLVKWIDEPTPMGLMRDVRNLVILTFAERINHSFFQHGGPYQPALDDVPSNLELRSIHLPSKADWEAAIKRGASIFGVTTSPLLNAINVAKFCEDVRTVAAQHQDSVAKLATRLSQILPQFNVEKDKSPRFLTGMATMKLIEAVQAGREDTVGTLIRATVPTTEAAMGMSLKKAGVLVGALDAPIWNVIEGLDKLGVDKQSTAQAILGDLREVLSADEHAVALAPALSALHDRAVKLLIVPPPPVVKPPVVDPPIKPLSPGWTKTDGNDSECLDTAALDELMRKLRQKLDGNTRLTIRWESYRREN